MTTTTAQAREAERASKAQRFRGRALLHIDDKRATPADMLIFQEMMEAKDADAYDALLVTKPVAELFRRGILFFGDVR
jgi:hypothetical protein